MPSKKIKPLTRYEIIKKISNHEAETHRQERKHYLAKNSNYFFNREGDYERVRRNLLKVIEIEPSISKTTKKQT